MGTHLRAVQECRRDDRACVVPSNTHKTSLPRIVPTRARACRHAQRPRARGSYPAADLGFQTKVGAPFPLEGGKSCKSGESDDSSYSSVGCEIHESLAESRGILLLNPSSLKTESCWISNLESRICLESENSTMNPPSNPNPIIPSQVS